MSGATGEGSTTVSRPQRTGAAPAGTSPQTASARIRLLTFPREHGAWGILLVPLIVGVAAGARTANAALPLLLLTVGALALFCLRTPIESLAGTSVTRVQSNAERRAVIMAIAAYSAVAGISLAFLVWIERSWTLIYLGAAVGGIFLAQALLKSFGRGMRFPAQLIGSLGLTSTSAAAYCVATGSLNSTALVLWAANWLFAANQIHYVQLRIHSARATSRQEKLTRAIPFLVGEVVLAIILIVAWQLGYISPLTALVFIPVLMRGLMWALSSRLAPLEVHRLGKSELAQAVVFGVLLILSLYLG